MPTATYIPLQTITLSSATTSLTFGSIPATFRDLILVASARNTTANVPFNQLRLRFNGDSGANYNRISAFGGNSVAVDSATGAVEFTIFFTEPSTSSSFSVARVQLMDYSTTDKQKTLLVRNDVISDNTGMHAGRWASTAAINSIQVYVPSGQFVVGSTFSLYGIAG